LLSRWSIVSLVLWALAIVFGFLFLWVRASLHVTEGDPAGLVITLVVIPCFFTACSWAVLGMVAGWVGLRRSHGQLALARTALLLNSALSLVGAILAVLAYFFDFDTLFVAP
jgi:hypothetical protein